MVNIKKSKPFKIVAKHVGEVAAKNLLNLLAQNLQCHIVVLGKFLRIFHYLVLFLRSAHNLAVIKLRLLAKILNGLLLFFRGRRTLVICNILWKISSKHLREVSLGLYRRKLDFSFLSLRLDIREHETVSTWCWKVQVTFALCS